MHARCPRCMTRQRVANPPAAGQVKRVACASCGAVFGVRGARAPEANEPAPSPPPRSPTVMGIPAANIPATPATPLSSGEGSRWQVRKRDGTVMQFPSLGLFQKWVADGVISLDDSISRNGHQWRPITSIPELVGLFERVAQARWGRHEPEPPAPEPEAEPGAPPPLPDLSNAPSWGTPSPAAAALLSDMPPSPPPLDDDDDLAPLPQPEEAVPPELPEDENDPLLADLDPPLPADVESFDDLGEVEEDHAEPPTPSPAVAAALAAFDDEEPPAAADPEPEALVAEALAAYGDDSADMAPEDADAEPETARPEPADEPPEHAGEPDRAPVVASTLDGDGDGDDDAGWVPSLDDIQSFPDDEPPPSRRTESPDDVATLQDFRIPTDLDPGEISLEEEMALAGETMEIRAPEDSFELGRAVELDLAARQSPPAPHDPFATTMPELDMGEQAGAQPDLDPDKHLRPVQAIRRPDVPIAQDETGGLSTPSSRSARYALAAALVAGLGGGGWYAWDLLQPVEPTWPDEMAVMRALASTPVAVAVPPPAPVAPVEPPAPEPADVLRLPVEARPLLAEARLDRRTLATGAAIAEKPRRKERPAAARKPDARKPVKRPDKPAEPQRKPADPGDNYDALMVAARKAQKSGRQRDAIKHLERASQLNPRSVEPIAKLGWAYLSLGNATQAILKFQEAKQKNPGYRDTYIGLAKAMERAGRTADAIAVYRQYLRMCPNCRKAEGVRASLMRLGADP